MLLIGRWPAGDKEISPETMGAVGRDECCRGGDRQRRGTPRILGDPKRLLIRQSPCLLGPQSTNDMKGNDTVGAGPKPSALPRNAARVRAAPSCLTEFEELHFCSARREARSTMEFVLFRDVIRFG